MILNWISSREVIVTLGYSSSDGWQNERLGSEEDYVAINEWCVGVLGYHARTAYDRFKLRSDGDVTAFVLRWQ